MYLITDKTSDWKKANPEQFNRVSGLYSRDWNKVIYGAPAFSRKWEAPVIPMERWPEIIKALDDAEASLYHVWKRSKIGILDQDGLSYCHGFACAGAIMLQREVQGLPYRELSASCNAARVTGYRNQGAYIYDNLADAVKTGLCTTKYCPMLTTKRNDFKPGWDTDAAKNRISHWWELSPRAFSQQGSALLSLIPVVYGFNWWGHAVYGLRVRDLYPSKRATDYRRYGIEIANSWSPDWGEEGLGVLTGDRMVGDEAYCPSQITIAA